MATVTQMPARVDLRIYAGDRLQLQVTLRQSGDPWDVSGETFAASTDDGSQLSVDMADAVDGVLVLTLDDPKPSARRWDLEMTSQHRTLVAGKMCVVEDVTRPALG